MAYALKVDGSIWSLRHLTDPNNHYLPFPTSTLARVGTDSGFVRVFASIGTTAHDHGVWAIKADGIPVPVDVSSLSGLPDLGVVADIAHPSWDYYAAVKPDKTLWVGSHYAGDVCEASQVPGATLQPAVPYLAGTGIAVATAAEPGNFAVVKTDGTLWTFGIGAMLGVGFIPMGTGLMSGYPARICKPARIGTGYVSVGFGANADVALALKQDGTLMAWGWKYVSVAQPNPAQLPRWEVSGTVMSPTQVFTGVADYASAGNLTIVRKSDGTIWVSERPGIPSDWRQIATGF